MDRFSVTLGDLLVRSDKPEDQRPAIRDDVTVTRVAKPKAGSAAKDTNFKKAIEVSMKGKSGVNIQDQFLNHMRREKSSVAVHLLDGTEIQGHIKSFDNFCIQLESGCDVLIYKHGISSIKPTKVSDK